MFTGPGRYTFTSVYIPDRSIDIPSPIAHRDEGRVQQYTSNGAVYQKWIVVQEMAAGKPTGLYRIQSLLGPSKVLGIEGDSKADYARVQFQRPSKSDFQLWRFVEEVGEAYRIVNEGSRLCIDLRHEDPSAGGELQQRPGRNVPHQLWLIEPA